MVDLPRDLFLGTCGIGIGMDFGSSAIKIVYTSEFDDKIRVHFTTKPREKHEEAFSLLAEKCSGKLEPGTEMFTCGVGGSEFYDKLSKQHGVRVSNVSEFETLQEAFMFLGDHLPWNQFVEGPSDATVEKAAQIVKMAKVFADAIIQKKAGDAKPTAFRELVALEDAQGQLPKAAGNHINFPCLMVLAGSTGAYIKVDDDGTCEICDSGFADRTFLGLGALLSKAKTFEELCDLAGKGDPRTVDVYTDVLRSKVSDDEGMYSAMKNTTQSRKAFSFGHGVGKCRADFKEEDLVRSMMSMLAENIAYAALGWAIQKDIKQVFFVGGFPCSNDIIQQELAEWFVNARLRRHHRCDCYFVKNGQHLGAVGAMLRTMGVTQSS